MNAPIGRELRKLWQHAEIFASACSLPVSILAGMVPTLGREIGGSAAMFATYEVMKRQFAQAQVRLLN